MSNKAIKLEQAQTLYGDMRTRHETFKGAIAPEYSNNSTYAAGAHVIYGDSLYKCITDISAAEEWTPAHWTQVTLDGDIGDTKADKTETVLNTTLSRGRKANTTVGESSFAFGFNVEASGDGSFAIGQNTTASGISSYAEGGMTQSANMFSHAEGALTIAEGPASHTGGICTHADAMAAHAIGSYNLPSRLYPEWAAGTSYDVGDRVLYYDYGYECKTANSDNTFVFANWKSLISVGTMTYPEWKANTAYAVGDRIRLEDHPGEGYFYGFECVTANSDAEFNFRNWKMLPSDGDTAFVIGNGTQDAEWPYSNALKVDWDGNMMLNGDVYVGCNTDSTGGTRLPHDVRVNGTSVVSNGVANVPLGDGIAYANGVLKIKTDTYTPFFYNSGSVRLLAPSDATIKNPEGNYGYNKRAISPENQHKATFYGLAKAAGDSTQSASSNAVGNYTDEAKAAIQAMLGVNVNDVQINGTSIVSNSIASIPVRTNVAGGSSELVTSNGISAAFSTIMSTTSAQIKAGTIASRAILPSNQHESVFYGLAKAAGDSTQSSSNDSVGTYTETAKSAISDMLNAPETVSGTTPSIAAKAGVRYICGEVSTISITPPQSGCVDIIFTSGSTPAVLTVPNTVKWPVWFNPANLVANATYEINILDGVYGAVSAWT